MRPNYVLIITYGRSGSTLLQGILNTIEGYCITGENNNAFLQLKQFYDRIVQAQNNNDHMENNWNVKNETNSWWNKSDEHDLLYHIRYLMNGLIDPTHQHDVIGFKEIRYNSVDNLEEYLDWLHYITNCKFIFLTRKLDDVVQSEWYRRHPESSKKKLRKFEDKIKTYVTANLEQDWFHIRYEDIISENKNLNLMFKWLDAPFVYDDVDKVLKTPHGYKTSGEIKTKLNNYGR